MVKYICDCCKQEISGRTVYATLVHINIMSSTDSQSKKDIEVCEDCGEKVLNLSWQKFNELKK